MFIQMTTLLLDYSTLGCRWRNAIVLPLSHIRRYPRNGYKSCQKEKKISSYDICSEMFVISLYFWDADSVSNRDHLSCEHERSFCACALYLFVCPAAKPLFFQPMCISPPPPHFRWAYLESCFGMLSFSLKVCSKGIQDPPSLSAQDAWDSKYIVKVFEDEVWLEPQPKILSALKN